MSKKVVRAVVKVAQYGYKFSDLPSIYDMTTGFMINCFEYEEIRKEGEVILFNRSILPATKVGDEVCLSLRSEGFQDHTLSFQLRHEQNNFYLSAFMREAPTAIRAIITGMEHDDPNKPNDLHVKVVAS